MNEQSTLTDEQKKQRLGLFSGSEIHKLMGVRGFGKTGETYIQEKVSEHLTGQPCKQEFTSAPTDWGIKHEPEAIKHFEAATGTKVFQEPITLVDEVAHICGTPDGILDGGDCGFEIKCPYNSGNHLKNLLMENQEDLLKLRPEYFWQIYCYMWLTGLEKWKFCSYDPRFHEEKRMFILNIDFNEKYLDMLKQRVIESKLIFDNLIAKLK